MGAPKVVDPDGITWNVRRRWYPWRRNMSLRELWAYTQSDDTDAEPEQTDVVEPESSLPRNIVAKVFFVVLAAIVWVVYSVGRVLFYTAVVALFLVISVIELILELVVMPITLVSGWWAQRSGPSRSTAEESISAPAMRRTTAPQASCATA